jgi:glycosyltransferase involved in cell wall biosynthesis
MEKHRKLRVLFLPAWYPTEENPVAGVFIKEHAKAVSLYNDVVVLYSEEAGKGVKGLYETISDKIEDGIKTVRIKRKKSPLPKTSFIIYIWSIIAAFRRLLKEGWIPDVIHAHIYFAGVPAVILGKIYKMPVIITEHWSTFPRYTLRKFDVLKARFAMNRAKIILPVSQNLKEAIESYGIRNRFRVVPNVVNTEIFYPSLNKNKSDKKKILLVAVLSPIKGIPYLLQALAQLKEKRQDFVLDIVGDGPNRQEYEEMTEKLELDKMVKFHGLKTKVEVAGFMRQCDFFVLPSLWENLPCVLIEAMASGIPVIATDVGGVKEMINENVGILIPPKNTKALEEAINDMLSDRANYSPEKIAKYAKGKFSYPAVGQQLDAIYRETLLK